jgi:hypothetical protein
MDTNQEINNTSSYTSAAAMTVRGGLTQAAKLHKTKRLAIDEHAKI